MAAWGKYIGAAWPGELVLGGKHFARALAIGAIELLFFFLFGGKAALKGLKAGIETTLKSGMKGLAKSGVKLAKEGVKNTLKSFKGLGTIAKEGFKNTIKNGKLVFQGLRKGALKGVKKLDDLGKRLGKYFRFKKFRVVVKSWRWKIEGYLNPWIELASGELVFVDAADPALVGKSVGDEITVGGTKGTLTHLDDPVAGAKGIGLKPEPKYLRGKEHGIKWQESDAFKRARETGNPQGKWADKADLEYAGQLADKLEPGAFRDFSIRPGSTSKVYMPDGTILDANMIRIRNNGNGSFHGFPINSSVAEPIRGSLAVLKP